MSGSALAGTGKEYSDPGRDLGGLSIGSHFAYIFGDSAEKQQRLFQLVSESLQDPSSAVLYIAGKQGVKGIRFSMKDYGIDVGAIERQRRIKIVDSEEWYLTAGKTSTFKPLDTIREQFTGFADAVKQAGYFYNTIISETDFLVRKGFFNQYQEVETELGKKIALLPAVFVCAYDDREIVAAGLQDVRKELSATHSSILS